MISLPRDISHVLDRGLTDTPDAPAVIARSGTLTYRELDAAADRCAAVLWALGIRPGDRVAATLPNDLDVVTAFHGAMRISAIWVGIGAALAAPEKDQLLVDCGATLYLTDEAGRPEAIDPAGDRWLALARTAPAATAPEIDPHAPAGIAYTSGTTGLPKGIVHSQHNLLVPGAALVETRGYDASLRKGDCLPLTILNLQVLTTLLTAQAGGCCVVMDRRDPEGVAAWIREQQITTWNGVPAQLFDLVRGDRADLADLASLTELWSGGADCSDDLRAAVKDALGLDVRGTYGLTEAPTVVTIDPIDGRWTPGSSGLPLPHLQVQVVGDDGNPLPAGEVGEFSISAATTGPWAGVWTPSLGVWREQAVEPGAAPLRTGDLGTLDADGWLSVRDRRTALIVRGGANVYPAEVERVLSLLPGVEAAAVIGVPDERLGQRVGVLIQGAPDLGKLKELCLERLAKYKVPEIWGAVEELPRNGMGKIIRRDLLALLNEHQS